MESVNTFSLYQNFEKVAQSVDQWTQFSLEKINLFSEDITLLSSNCKNGTTWLQKIFCWSFCLPVLFVYGIEKNINNVVLKKPTYVSFLQKLV